MIDCVEIETDLKRNAEFLYELLTNKHLITGKIPMLIACNKEEIAMFKKSYIKRNLEKELEILRITKASQPAAQDETEKPLELVEKQGAKFTFDTARIKVSFEDCSVATEKVSEVAKYIVQ